MNRIVMVVVATIAIVTIVAAATSLLEEKRRNSQIKDQLLLCFAGWLTGTFPGVLTIIVVLTFFLFGVAYMVAFSGTQIKILSKTAEAAIIMVIILILVLVLAICAGFFSNRDKSQSDNSSQNREPTKQQAKENINMQSQGKQNVSAALDNSNQSRSILGVEPRLKQTVFDAELVEEPKCSIQPTQRQIKQMTQFDVVMLRFLQASGVEYIDNRQKNGALWIVGDSQLSSVAQECKYRFDVHFTFKPEGGQCTKHRPAWWTRGYASKSTIITDAVPQVTHGKVVKQIEGQTSIDDILSGDIARKESRTESGRIEEARKQRNEIAIKKEKEEESYRFFETQYMENKVLLDKLLTNEQIDTAVGSGKLSAEAAQALKKLRNDTISTVTNASKSKSASKAVITFYDFMLSKLDDEIEASTQSPN